METPEEKIAREAAEAAAAEAEAEKAKGGTDDVGISPEAQAQIDALKKQLDDSEAGRKDAERRAHHNAGQASAAVADAADAELQLVTTAIETVNATQSALKAKLRDALAASDFDMAADIQEEMALSAAKLLQLQNGKEAMEGEKRTADAKRKAGGAQQGGDPVEALASQLTPKSAAWVRSHPEYVTDQRKNRIMIRAHEDAIDHGHAPDSDGYFKFVETRLGITSGTAAAAAAEGGEESALSGAAGAAKKRDGAPPALPANRGGSPAAHSRRLTPEEKEIAKLNGQTDEEYAQAKEALQKEGRLSIH